MVPKGSCSYVIAVLMTIVRYYDYALFGLSASVISRTFMPGSNGNEQMLAFFAVFSIAVIARPIGSIIFGKIGDQVGRVASVKMATIIAAISTSAVALIPSFSFWGWFSVILLTVFRMMFLISLAGEVDAIKIFVAEKISKKRRNFAIGMVSFSSQLGVILASIMYHIAISSDQLELMWRLNFIFGGLLGMIVIMLRGYLQESQIFLKSKSRQTQDAGLGILPLIISNRLKFFLAMVVSGILGGGYNFLIVFLGTFAANVAGLVTLREASSNNIILIILFGVGCFISGYLADKINALMQILVALVISMLCIFIMGILIYGGFYSFTLHKILALTIPFYSVPCVIKIQSLFLTGLRMRMYSLSHSLGSMLFSSTTPFICMLVWRKTEAASLVLGYFLLQLLILFLTLIYLSKKEYSNFFET